MLTMNIMAIKEVNITKIHENKTIYLLDATAFTKRRDKNYVSLTCKVKAVK